MANNSMMAKNVFFSFESKKQQNGKQIKSWEKKRKEVTFNGEENSIDSGHRL